jgi:hypothetical protein
MNNKKIFSSIPIEFDKQDEGHDYHNPRTWNILTNYFPRGNYSYKRTSNQTILTGPFRGTQTYPKDLLEDYKKTYTVRNFKKF